MRSTTGQYYQGLDHLRALAVFLVFSWHFLHFQDGHLAGPIGITPLSLLTEGHTGVALFMVLSGYLFAKLLDNRGICYKSFLINRAFRLLPLLVIVILIVSAQKALQGEFTFAFVKSVAKGFLYPTLPNGGWSITVEFHFYLALPFLLSFIKGSWARPVVLLLAAIFLRLVIWWHEGEVQSLAYWTIVGRFDQFLLGILAYRVRFQIKDRTLITVGLVITFVFFWRMFDQAGGFYTMPNYPSPSALWILIPTIEGLAYAVLVAWYDTRTKNSSSFAARSIAAIGAYSYSIYLLHFFFVFRMPQFINDHIVTIEGIGVALAALVMSFLLMVPVGWASHMFLERPFLKKRRSYFKTTA